MFTVGVCLPQSIVCSMWWLLILVGVIMYWWHASKMYMLSASLFVTMVCLYACSDGCFMHNYHCKDEFRLAIEILSKLLLFAYYVE